MPAKLLQDDRLGWRVQKKKNRSEPDAADHHSCAVLASASDFEERNPITGFMDVPYEERDYVLPNAKNFPGLLTAEDVFAERPTQGPQLE